MVYLHNYVERSSQDGLSKVFRCSNSKNIWDLRMISYWLQDSIIKLKVTTNINRVLGSIVSALCAASQFDYNFTLKTEWMKQADWEILIWGRDSATQSYDPEVSVEYFEETRQIAEKRQKRTQRGLLCHPLFASCSRAPESWPKIE